MHDGEVLHTVCMAGRHCWVSNLCVPLTGTVRSFLLFSHGLPLLFHRSILSGINQKWDPNRLTEFHVVDRENGGVVAKYKVKSFVFPTSYDF